jgi:hypothetical protein
MNAAVLRKLDLIADVLPSGANVSIDNEHDVPNATGWFVDMFQKDGYASHDDVAEFFRDKGWDESNVTFIANLADIVWLTMRHLRVSTARDS